MALSRPGVNARRTAAARLSPRRGLPGRRGGAGGAGQSFASARTRSCRSELARVSFARSTETTVTAAATAR